MRGIHAIHVFLLVGLLSLSYFYPVLQAWPLYLLVPLGLYGIIVVAVRPLRHSVNWMRRGSIDLTVGGLTAATIVVASAALVLWYRFIPSRSDLSDLGGQIPNWDLPYLLLAGVGFSVLNALLEEIIFRGVLYEALVEDYGPLLAVCIQGGIFGFVHAHGFPRGVVGIVLASIYGLMLGFLRQRSGGLLAPFLAHIFADATIFAIMLFHLDKL
jgi:membrane protease YdiL (CAAX protease family)